MSGATVVLTREPEDNAVLRERLGTVAAKVVELPCVRIVPLEETGALAAALADLRREDWLVVTSRHGADAIARHPTPRAAIAAVGGKTADRLRAHGYVVDFEPRTATGDPSGERLARELPPCAGRVLLARSDRALRDLPLILRERGFTVDEVVAYRTFVGARGDVDALRDELGRRADVRVLFHSPSAVEGMLSAIEPTLLARASIFVIGRSTLRAVRERVGVAARVALIEEEDDVAHR